ncbi:hypothetical protein [Arthrobacter sp. HLT1-21]
MSGRSQGFTAHNWDQTTQHYFRFMAGCYCPVGGTLGAFDGQEDAASLRAVSRIHNDN